MDDDTNNERPEDEARHAERLAIRKRAMDLLARREHARAELVTKLKKHEHAADDIEAVLDELVEDGLQSDARYAEAAVASKARRGIGPIRIRAELRGAGVNDGEIEAALAEAGVDWDELAEAARRKRFGAELPADFPARAKQMRFLQRRGFDADQLAAAFDD
ncbi:regulatory protein RecX [Salinisphaera sp. LB1]|uniref:regulatory protein RecX n=1 Tax=Salinisphaera sp. LB1 TaxID=2183911 RepID=UPI000D707791|nr:regulatory protein RecX [Salinisphaera sp. LB1]AWN14495.1 Regulatory protein RecX [Salinisphaera sp. LB1]